MLKILQNVERNVEKVIIYYVNFNETEYQDKYDVKKTRV